MTLLVPRQSQEEEWMDGDHYSIEDLEASLEGLRWVNQNLRGYQIILRNLQTLIHEHGVKKFSILDVATGSADIPIKIVQWARKQGLKVSILAIDKNPNIIKIAQKETLDYPEITLEVCDFYEAPYSENFFDYCLSSLFLHHLEPTKAIPFLKRMYHLCYRAVFVNDLVRGWVPYYSYKVLAGLFRLHPMTRHDGAVSVLRAFTIPEFKRLIKPEFDFYEIKKHFPYRFGLTIRKKKSYG